MSWVIGLKKLFVSFCHLIKTGLIHTLAASNFVDDPRSCCPFCFDDPALVSPNCEDQRFLYTSRLLFLFYRRINIKHWGEQHSILEGFSSLNPKISLQPTVLKRIGSEVNATQLARVLGLMKSDRVILTAFVHNLAKWRSSGHSWRPTPSLRVLEHTSATPRCGIIVFLGAFLLVMRSRCACFWNVNGSRMSSTSRPLTG